MWVQGQLQAELHKLIELTPHPTDLLSFAMGYLAFKLPQHPVIPIVTPLVKANKLVQKQKITALHFLQLLTVLKFNHLSQDPDTLRQSLIQQLCENIDQLAEDPQYLAKLYFRNGDKRLELAECPICLCGIDRESACMLTCDHLFHKSCIVYCARERISENNVPLVCPEEGCGQEISELELLEYLPRELVDKYHQFMFQHYVDVNSEEASWCPTPGCSAAFVNDKNVTEYKCRACEKHYCLACKTEMHVGMSCQDYQKINKLEVDDQARQFLLLARGNKMKQCPRCKFWVDRTEGCSHMTCRCKYQFCFTCGGKYGKCKCSGHGRAGKDFFKMDFDKMFGDEQEVEVKPEKPKEVEKVEKKQQLSDKKSSSRREPVRPVQQVERRPGLIPKQPKPRAPKGKSIPLAESRREVRAPKRPAARPSSAQKRQPSKHEKVKPPMKFGNPESSDRKNVKNRLGKGHKKYARPAQPRMLSLMDVSVDSF